MNEEHPNDSQSVTLSNEENDNYSDVSLFSDSFEQNPNEVEDNKQVREVKKHLTKYERMLLKRNLLLHNNTKESDKSNDLPVMETIKEVQSISKLPFVCKVPKIELSNRIVRYRTPFEVIVTISIYWREINHLTQQDIVLICMSMQCALASTIKSEHPEIIESCSFEQNSSKNERPIIEINATNLDRVMQHSELGFERYIFNNCTCNCTSSKRHLNDELCLVLELPNGPYFSESFVSLTKVYNDIQFKWKGGSRTAEQLGITNDPKHVLGKNISPFQDGEVKEIISIFLDSDPSKSNPTDYKSIPSIFSSLRDLLFEKSICSIIKITENNNILFISCPRKLVDRIVKICNDFLEDYTAYSPFLCNSYSI